MSSLTSLLKSQYGSTNKQNTPKSHKRKNYNGIGAQAKKKAKQTEVRHEASEDDEDVQVSNQRRGQKSTAEKRKILSKMMMLLKVQKSLLIQVLLLKMMKTEEGGWLV